MLTDKENRVSRQARLDSSLRHVSSEAGSWKELQTSLQGEMASTQAKLCPRGVVCEAPGADRCLASYARGSLARNHGGIGGGGRY